MKKFLNMIKIPLFLMAFVLIFFPAQANAQSGPVTDYFIGVAYVNTGTEFVEQSLWACNDPFSYSPNVWGSEYFRYLPPYICFPNPPQEGNDMYFRAFYGNIAGGQIVTTTIFMRVYRMSDGLSVMEQGYGITMGEQCFGCEVKLVTSFASWAPAQPGDYCVQSIIDPLNEFAESNENNNEETRCFTVTSAPTPTPLPQPPTLDSLTVTNAGNTGFVGVSGITGRQSGADSGSDWFNPINVTVIVSQGSSAIKEYYVKFTPGFEVAYTTTPGSIGGNCTGQWCYNSGGWNSLPPTGVTSGGVTVFPNGANSWQAKYAPSFGSNNISTSAYVKDVNNLCSGGSCTYAVLSGKTCSDSTCTIP